MCAMALLHARVKRVVYGARDPKAGAAGSVIDVFGTAALNHHTQVEGGLLAEASGAVLRSFFAERREQFRQRRAGSVAAPAETDFSAEPIPAGESLEIDPKAER
jgi:tRNA(adenine34) deaminase